MANVDLLKQSTLFRLANLDTIDKQFLIERHLMSIEHAQKTEHKAVLISPEEIISVMINEEDHLRIQLMQSGFNLFEAWNIINAVTLWRSCWIMHSCRILDILRPAPRIPEPVCAVL